MSRHLCREDPSSSSRRRYLPPSREALWPSLGWPQEGGGARQRPGRREGQGGERVRGTAPLGTGTAVLWIDTSVWGEGGWGEVEEAREGTREPPDPSSGSTSGFIRAAAITPSTGAELGEEFETSMA